MQLYIAIIASFGVAASILFKSFWPVLIAIVLIIIIALSSKINISKISIPSVSFKNGQVWMFLGILILTSFTTWWITSPNKLQKTLVKTQTTSAKSYGKKFLVIKPKNIKPFSIEVVKFQKDENEISFVIQTQRNGKQSFFGRWIEKEKRFSGNWYDRNNNKRGEFFLNKSLRGKSNESVFCPKQGWTKMCILKQ